MQTFAELQAEAVKARMVADQLDAAVAEARDVERRNAIATIQSLVATFELDSNDVKLPAAKAAPARKAANGAAAKTPRVVGAVKYKEPNGSGRWTGRGRQPAWYQAALKAGATADSMRV